MKKISMMALVATFCVAGSLWACDKDGKIAKVSGKTPPCCQKQLDGAVSKVVSSMPNMTYRVGDFETCCSKTAAAKAGADGKVQYVVAAKRYDNETEASIALAELLEKEIETLKTVQFAAAGKTYGCPLSAKAAVKEGQQMQYRLAGFDFATKESADLALKIINCKLSGCQKDCRKDCLWGARQAGAKSRCNKGKTAQVASAKDLPCHQGLAGAKTIADGQKPCCAKGKAAKAATVAGKDSPCSKSAKAVTVATKDSPCSKGAKAATVAGKTSPCGKSVRAATVASKVSPCSKSTKAATVAGNASPCSKSGKALTVSAQSKGGCCKKAQQRLATAQDQIQTIVKAAASVALAS